MTRCDAYTNDNVTIFVFRDRRGSVHLLTKWEDGAVTFTWDWREQGALEPDDPYKRFYRTEITDPALLKLAEAWRTYLDEVIE